MNDEWIKEDRMMYEDTWINRDGAELRIEDVTKILSPTEQTHLSDFNNEQYRVLTQEPYQSEAVLHEEFAEYEEAVEYVEEEFSV